MGTPDFLLNFAKLKELSYQGLRDHVENYLFVNFHDEKRTFVLDIGQTESTVSSDLNLPVVKELSAVDQLNDPEKYVRTGFEICDIQTNSVFSHYLVLPSDGLSHWRF